METRTLVKNLQVFASVDVTVNQCKSVFTFFHCTVQWDYSGKWDTIKKCKNYMEYICSMVGSFYETESETWAGLCLVGQIRVDECYTMIYF